MYRTAQAINLDKKQIILLSKNIIEYLKEVLFIPMITMYKSTYNDNIKLNALSSELEQAFKANRIYYKDGYVYGKLNAKLSKELQDLGAVYNKNKKAFKLEEAPIEITNIIYSNQNKLKQMVYNLDDFLNDYVSNLDSSLQFLNLSYNDTLNNYHEQLKDNLSEFGIIPNLNNYEKESLNNNYTETTKKYIKNWLEKDIIKFRNEMKQYVLEDGYNSLTLAKKIQKQYNVSQDKAVFLARQESNLLLAEYSKNKYKKMGFNSYEWQTANDEKVRDYPKNNESGGNHKALNHLIFNYDDPPIVNQITGERANPGEAYNCRCVGAPVIK